MQLDILLTALLSLGALTAASGTGERDSPLLPRRAKNAPAKRPENLVYVRSWESIRCPAQPKWTYDQVHSFMTHAPAGDTQWIPQAQAFRFTWSYENGDRPWQNQAYFHLVKNDIGFPQYRFTTATATDLHLSSAHLHLSRWTRQCHRSVESLTW